MFILISRKYQRPKGEGGGSAASKAQPALCASEGRKKKVDFHLTEHTFAVTRNGTDELGVSRRFTEDGPATLEDRFRRLGRARRSKVARLARRKVELSHRREENLFLVNTNSDHRIAESSTHSCTRSTLVSPLVRVIYDRLEFPGRPPFLYFSFCEKNNNNVPKRPNASSTAPLSAAEIVLSYLRFSPARIYIFVTRFDRYFIFRRRIPRARYLISQPAR